MKKNLILALVLFSANLFAQEARYDTIRWAREHYQKMVVKYNQDPIRKNRIIFLGNSITEYADWRKLLQDSTVINRGIAADNTFGVLERLDDVIERNPSKLFLEIGVNDIGQDIPLTITRDNIIKIVSRVHAESPATKIYVVSVLPTNENVKDNYPALYHKNNLIEQLNRMIEKASRMTRFTFVDVNKALSASDGTLSLTFADPDGVHLNEQGYQVWIKLLKTKRYL